MDDLNAWGTGTMPSALLRDLIKPVLEYHHAGHKEAAVAQYPSILPLISYENHQCGLRATKAAMLDGGVIQSDTVRKPFSPLHPDSRKGLLELVRPLNPVVLSRYK